MDIPTYLSGRPIIMNRPQPTVHIAVFGYNGRQNYGRACRIAKLALELSNFAQSIHTASTLIYTFYPHLKQTSLYTVSINFG